MTLPSLPEVSWHQPLLMLNGFLGKGIPKIKRKLEGKRCIFSQKLVPIPLSPTLLVNNKTKTTFFDKELMQNNDDDTFREI